MSNKDTPAYPSAISASPDGGYFESSCWGLTKLEAFTMAALQGLCSNMYGSDTPQSVAKIAVEIAEAALAELEGKTP